MSSSQPNASSSAFAQLDTDQSGFLGREEIRAAVAARGLPSAHVQAFIDAADHDGDGRISLGEFLRFCDQREAQLHSVFTRLDRNGDGRLTGEEIRAGCDALGVRVSHEQQRGLMQRLDANGDGGVSFDEFRSLLLLLPEVNPVAVIEAFQLTAHIEHAEGACTPPPERNAANQSLMQALLAKLWAGGVAGAVSRTATAPIDRIKTMMQVAPSGGGGGGMAVVRAIQQEGGVAAFWRGNTANVLKIAPETAIKFIAFDSLKGAVARDPATATAAERFVAGGAAGAIAQVVIYPMEVAKTRLAVSPASAYSGMLDVLTKVVRAEGGGALYRGLGTSVVGIVPYAGIDLSVNSLLKDGLGRHYAARGIEPGVPALLACGMLSSTCAMLSTYPINLIRTRLQISGMPGAPSYTGPLDCFRQTVRTGGVAALFQGLLPNMLKVLPATSISYAVYDALSKV